jgi:hypothetical protein
MWFIQLKPDTTKKKHHRSANQKERSRKFFEQKMNERRAAAAAKKETLLPCSRGIPWLRWRKRECHAEEHIMSIGCNESKSILLFHYTLDILGNHCLWKYGY